MPQTTTSPRSLEPISQDEIVYAGIGSRKTPGHVLSAMRRFGRAAAEAGWVLRSGNARGADSAFEAGCDEADGRKRIFYATQGDAEETGNPNGHHLVAGGPPFLDTVDDFHPAPEKLSGYARRLMARNAAQVFGAHLKRSANVVLCWTPDGIQSGHETTEETGGTGQALRLAASANIPVINVHWRETYELIDTLSEILSL